MAGFAGIAPWHGFLALERFLLHGCAPALEGRCFLPRGNPPSNGQVMNLPLQEQGEWSRLLHSGRFYRSFRPYNNKMIKNMVAAFLLCVLCVLWLNQKGFLSGPANSAPRAYQKCSF